MATVTTEIDSTAYVSVNASSVEGIIQNTGTTDVLLIFTDSGEPLVDATNFHVLKARDNQAVQIVNNIPSGAAWVRAYGEGKTSSVAVSN